MGRAIAALVSERLTAAADPQAAPGMQRYMKSSMPFLGVRAPLVKGVVSGVVRGYGPLTWEGFLDAATALWEAAEHREQWYAAQVLTGYAPARGRLEFLPLYERMVLEGAWWDVVDNCHRRFGDLLRAHRADIDPLLRAWATDENHWKRRSAIIAQLSAKAETDTALLGEVILPSIGEADFFLRKGIGWALREYAKTDPAWVRAFVREHEGLSGLSRREALKHLGGSDPV